MERYNLQLHIRAHNACLVLLCYGDPAGKGGEGVEEGGEGEGEGEGGEGGGGSADTSALQEVSGNVKHDMVNLMNHESKRIRIFHLFGLIYDQDE